MKHLLACSLLVACASTEEFSGTFDTPTTIAVLHPDQRSPFDEPVGYAADAQGGHIRALALSRGVYLADQPYASWFRGNGAGTGALRLLGDVVPYSPDGDTVQLLAIDRRFQQLLVVPHITSKDANGRLTGRVITLSDPVWSGSVPLTLDGLDADRDTAATETWTFTWNGTSFDAAGTRSGPQRPAFPDVAWEPTDRALSFVPRLSGGEPTIGDTVTVDVDAGIVEIDLEGTPLALDIAPTQDWFALSIDTGAGVLLELRQTTAPDIATSVALPEGSRPGRLAFSADGTTLVVADLALATNGTGGKVHLIDVDTAAVTTIPMPWATADADLMVYDDADGTTHRELFVHPSQRSEVWLYDADTGLPMDVNPWTPDPDPMRFEAPVRGLTTMAESYVLPVDADENPRTSRSVAISLASGKVVWMEKGTGCLVSDAAVPRTRVLSSFSLLSDYEPDFPIQIPGTAFLENTEDAVRHVGVNPCAGIAQAETWRLTYDEVRQGWEVEGLLSGVQTALAREDERFVSDGGEISFLMRSGPVASQDGWTITFEVLSGVLQADGDNAGDLLREVAFDDPGEPVAYFWPDPDADNEGTRIPFVVVALQASDVVARVRGTTGFVDALWD